MLNLFSRPVSLETAVPGLTLRLLTADDVPAFFALIDRNREILAYWGEAVEERAVDLEGAYSLILECQLTGEEYFGIWKEGSLIGTALLSVPNLVPRTRAVGYMIDSEHTGHRYAMHAVNALVEHAFQDPGVLRLAGATREDNLASRRTLCLAGFTFSHSKEGFRVLFRYRPQV